MPGIHQRVLGILRERSLQIGWNSHKNNRNSLGAGKTQKEMLQTYTSVTLLAQAKQVGSSKCFLLNIQFVLENYFKGTNPKKE